MGKRNYIDVDEDMKNPLMNLKKAMDLGYNHSINLKSGEIAHIHSDDATVMVEGLLAVSPQTRAKVLDELITNIMKFEEIKNTLLKFQGTNDANI